MEGQPNKSSRTLRARLLTLVETKYQHKARPQTESPFKRAELKLQAAKQQAKPRDVVPGFGTTFAGDLRDMTFRAWCFTEAYGIQQGQADRTGCDKRILEFERALVKVAFKLGVPLYARTVHRTSADQNRLHRAALSDHRAGESPHNYGCAADIVHGTKGVILTPKQWAIIGHLGRECATRLGVRVTWGGDWPEPRPEHWELTDWEDIRAQYADGEDFDGRN